MRNTISLGGRAFDSSQRNKGLGTFDPGFMWTRDRKLKLKNQKEEIKTEISLLKFISTPVKRK